MGVEPHRPLAPLDMLSFAHKTETAMNHSQALIVLVHPGSLCGSLETAHDWHPRWRKYAHFKREFLCTEFRFFAGRRFAIMGGELDDEIPDYPSVFSAVEAADEKYPADATTSQLQKVARAVWRKHHRKPVKIVVTGAWADPKDGCARVVYLVLKHLARRTSTRVRLSCHVARFDVTTAEIKRGPFNPLGNRLRKGMWHVTQDKAALRHNERRLREFTDRQSTWKQLGERLKRIGGTAVCAQFEEDMQPILDEGRTWTPRQKDIRMANGRQSRCHDNALLLAAANRHLQVWTGYALSNDGIWRSHSWCVDRRSWTIVETTNKRVAYHGACLPREVARDRLS